MTDVDHTLLIIKEIEDDWYKPPRSNKMKKAQFDMMSYQRWALQEIRNEILRHQELEPMETIYDFKQRMADYACESKTINANVIFSIAVDVCIDLIDVLRGSM